MDDQKWDAFLAAKIEEANFIRAMKYDRRAWFDPRAGKAVPAVDPLPPQFIRALR